MPAKFKIFKLSLGFSMLPLLLKIVLLLIKFATHYWETEILKFVACNVTEKYIPKEFIQRKWRLSNEGKWFMNQTVILTKNSSVWKKDTLKIFCRENVYKGTSIHLINEYNLSFYKFGFLSECTVDNNLRCKEDFTKLKTETKFTIVTKISKRVYFSLSLSG